MKLQSDNDSLMGAHSKFAQQLQNEDINLPNNMEVMHLRQILQMANHLIKLSLCN